MSILILCEYRVSRVNKHTIIGLINQLLKSGESVMKFTVKSPPLDVFGFLPISSPREEDIPKFSSLEEEVRYWRGKALKYKER